ncbi:MAG: PAS domain S-box protein, partial [Bacteroidales bacterium]|nr:PAS domain S-box protein [Bacteroidales bacterium]
MGVAFDITQRYIIEQDLKKYRLVLDQAPGAVFIIDKQSNFEYINPHFTFISGYSEDDLLNKNIFDVLYYGKLPESRKEVFSTIQAGKNWQGELLTFKKDGSTYWANTIAAPFKNENGEVDGFIVIQQDITRRKEMEIALQESENLYRALIEKSLDGITITQNGKILFVNKAFCDITGYTQEEFVNIGPEELLAPEDRERVVDIHYRRMRGEIDTLKYSANFLHKSGRKIYVDLNSTTVQYKGNNASFISMRDVTEKKNMEEAIIQSEAKYRELVETT